MKPELKEKILKYNRSMAKNREKAEDFMHLLNALPPGQVKNLLKDDRCTEILNKYGISA